MMNLEIARVICNVREIIHLPFNQALDERTSPAPDADDRYLLFLSHPLNLERVKFLTKTIALYHNHNVLELYHTVYVHRKEFPTYIKSIFSPFKIDYWSLLVLCSNY